MSYSSLSPLIMNIVTMLFDLSREWKFRKQKHLVHNKLMPENEHILNSENQPCGPTCAQAYGAEQKQKRNVYPLSLLMNVQFRGNSIFLQIKKISMMNLLDLIRFVFNAER